jgi:glycosyltransferase involved in cell wall biosynthesis
VSDSSAYVAPVVATPAPTGSLAPYFATAPNPAARRRMLLVFFDFAPSAEVGALRWVSMSRFGNERGWAFDVVTVRPEFMGVLDESRLTQLPPGVRVFGFDGQPPGWYRGLVGMWRKAQSMTGGGHTARPGPAMVGHLDAVNIDRSAVAVDRASPWRKAFRSRVRFALADVFADRAAELGLALARENHYDLILSSGPPHAAHDAARQIAIKTGLPFVMDMRDPWSDASAMPEDLQSRTWTRAAKVHEDQCIAAADLLVVTSQAHAALQESKYAAIRGRVRTVMNGADLDDLPRSDPGDRFVVAFAGMIYLGRNPRTLFRAAARVARETGATPEQFGVEFLGDEACEGVPLTTIANEEGLGPHFRSLPFRPRREAMSFLARASVLVSLPLNTTMTLPAKLFEYIRFDAWLLALAEPGSATAELLRDTGADVVSPRDVDGIARALRARYDAFRRGERPVSINKNGQFDRSTQATHLYNALDELVASSNGAKR